MDVNTNNYHQNGNSSREAASDTAEEAASVLTEFIEAITHHILHARKVYPREAFERTRMYGVAVQRCRHPGLRSYISETASSQRALIASGSVRKVAITLLTSDRSMCIERYLINLDVPAAHTYGGSKSTPAAARERSTADDVERRLAGCFTKASVVAQQQKLLPEGAAFELVAYSSERSHNSEFWVEEGPIGGSGRLELQQPKQLKAIKDCQSSVLSATLALETSAEEHP